MFAKISIYPSNVTQKERFINGFKVPPSPILNRNQNVNTEIGFITNVHGGVTQFKNLIVRYILTRFSFGKK